MARVFHPLILLLARATSNELAQMVDYLKTENRILRSKLPRRVDLTPAERERLVKHGKPLGTKIKELITIVSPRTFARWLNGETKSVGKQPGKGGRPRKPEELRQLVVQMAKDNGWGLGRIMGELKKLGIMIAKGTVRNILLENGFDLGPTRGEGSWDEFMKMHAKTLWACDFFSKKVWTLSEPGRIVAVAVRCSGAGAGLGALGAVVRRSASRANSAARRRARSERSPSANACMRQAIRRMSHCLWRAFVSSPNTSAYFARSSLTVIRFIAATSFPMSRSMRFSLSRVLGNR
jgi:hypothetical protein